MNIEQAERRFRELQRQRDAGKLDEDAFRVEVAKLLFRDERGIFWMLDAEEEGWFCNRGDGWTAGDPHTEGPPESLKPSRRSPMRRRLVWGIALGVAAIALLVLAPPLILQLWPLIFGNSTPQAATEGHSVRVTIASPANGSEVALGQEVAIESMIDAVPDLQMVAHVDLVVNGETVDRQPVQPKIRPGQTALPLSQPWLPTTFGEYQVAVVAFTPEEDPVGVAAITLQAKEAPDETLPEPACIPDATFVKDVTIPPGTAFPPGARMDKVWQVRNIGSCAWGVGYELTLVQGEKLSAPDTVPVPPTAAGESADLTVSLWAPEEAGSYASVWQLESREGEFFGPTLTLDIQVEILAQENLTPTAPSDLQAAVTEDGEAMRLTWVDQSDNEDAFRIYREDVEASIGLAPANAVLFLDENVACGNTYRYTVVAFNAAGSSPETTTAEVVLPPCAPTDEPPSLGLTVTPTQIIAGQVFTITFLANDDMGLDLVVVWGEETGEPVLDRGQFFPCTATICSADWQITSSGTGAGRLTVMGIARDLSGQESELSRTSVIVRSEE